MHFFSYKTFLGGTRKGPFFNENHNARKIKYLLFFFLLPIVSTLWDKESRWTKN